MKLFGTAFALVLLAACLVLTAPAQTTFGTITGTISDATGAVIPNAPVAVTNEETGVVRRASTSASGVYSIVDLQPGNYKLSVEAKGFVPAERGGLVLFANRVVNVDLQLNIGASATQIQVSSDAPLVN